MKKTQMIHSPRTLKIGLGLLLGASLASMPVLTGASERQEAKAAAITKAATTSKTPTPTETEQPEDPATDKPSKQKSKEKSAAQQATTGKSKNSSQTEGAKGKARRPSAEDRAKQRRANLELKAKAITDRLSPSQKTKLLALLNDSKPDELAAIHGIGKARSTAIEKARPIASIETLPSVDGVGLKTLSDVVDHGRGMTPANKAAPNPAKPKSKPKPDSPANPKPPSKTLTTKG